MRGNLFGFVRESEMHVYEVRPRKDKRGVDLISDPTILAFARSLHLPPVLSLINRLLLLCDIRRYSLLRFGVVPNCEIGNVEVVREVLPFCFKLEVVHFYKEHRPLIFDADNSRSRLDARKRGPPPHR
jgi:hypothetical protein